MNLTLKQQVIILVVCTAGGVAVGRFATPAKVVIQTKTVEVAKTDTKMSDTTKHHTHKDTTTVTIKKPDGTEETTTKTVVDNTIGNDISTTTASSASSNQDYKSEKTGNQGHLNLSLLAGANPFNLTNQPGLVYGAHITRDVFGPLNIGVWGLSNGTCGMSVGLTF